MSGQMPGKEAPQEPTQIPPSQAILQMLTGKWIAQAISVAATLGIADFLRDGPQGIEHLAKATSAHADSLYRLLRALASVGIFAETDGGRFALTPLGQCLRSDAPDSVRNWARLYGIPLSWRSWGELLHSVKTGETGFKQAFGTADPFEYLSRHPEEASVFNDAMTDRTRSHGPGIAAAYDFGRFKKIIDLGGGHGTLLITLLRRYPGLRGVVFDLPQVVTGAQAAIAAAGLSDRCEAIAGDILESVPAGADGYLTKSIIHGFDKDNALAVLRNIRQAIQPDGRLLLVEFVVPPGNEPSLGKLLDLQMLVIPGGRERTEEEFRDLFGAAGFKLSGIHPTATPQSIIEGIPA
jgi:SAM-dependent methyltransferase